MRQEGERSVCTTSLPRCRQSTHGVRRGAGSRRLRQTCRPRHKPSLPAGLDHTTLLGCKEQSTTRTSTFLHSHTHPPLQCSTTPAHLLPHRSTCLPAKRAPPHTTATLPQSPPLPSPSLLPSTHLHQRAESPPTSPPPPPFASTTYEPHTHTHTPHTPGIRHARTRNITEKTPSPVNLLKQLCCNMGRSGVTVDDSIRCFGPFLLLLPLCSAKVGTGKSKHTTFIRNFSTNLFPRCVFLPSYVTINETPPHIVFVALSGPHRRITICTPDLLVSPPPSHTHPQHATSRPYDHNAHLLFSERTYPPCP